MSAMITRIDEYISLKDEKICTSLQPFLVRSTICFHENGCHRLAKLNKLWWNAPNMPEDMATEKWKSSGLEFVRTLCGSHGQIPYDNLQNVPSGCTTKKWCVRTIEFCQGCNNVVVSRELRISNILGIQIRLKKVFVNLAILFL